LTSTSSGEPLDLSRSRSGDSEEDTATDRHAAAGCLPSPSVSDPDDCHKTPASVNASPGTAVVLPSPRRSSRQRRRTAKAAGEDGCGSVEEVVTPRRHHQHQRAGGTRPAYICTLCDKQFTKHSSLVRHTYQHSGQTRSSSFLSRLSCP